MSRFILNVKPQPCQKDDLCLIVLDSMWSARFPIFTQSNIWPIELYKGWSVFWMCPQLIFCASILTSCRIWRVFHHIGLEMKTRTEVNRTHFCCQHVSSPMCLNEHNVCDVSKCLRTLLYVFCCFSCPISDMFTVKDPLKTEFPVWPV